MQLTLPAKDVLCVYGQPDHELSSELMPWLEEDSNRFLVILEDDERLLFSLEPTHERMHICSLEEKSLKKAAWELVFLEFTYFDRPGNSLKDPEKMYLAFAKMTYLQEGVHLVASGYKERGLDLLHNYLKNQKHFSAARDGRELFGKFTGIPAIICGAGASLENESACLKAMEDRALIFAGGSAVECLSKMGMKPHFSAFIDPHPPSREVREISTPTFFQSRAHPDILQNISGPLLWTPGSSIDFFEDETFDGGWNVSTYLASLAFHMGCDPIILVGVDLAQKEDRPYAAGVERPEGGELVPLPEKGLFSRKDWLFAGDFLNKFAEKNSGVEWINASDGLEIAGFAKKELGQIHLENRESLRKTVQEAIASTRQGIAISIDADALKESFAKASELAAEMLELLEKLFPHSPEKSGEYALLQREIEKEIAFQRFLSPIWDVWKHVLARQIPGDIPEEYGLGLNRWLFIKGVCDDARKGFAQMLSK